MNPPHTIQEVEDLILNEFDLLWGIAPPDSLKGERGAYIHDWLRSQIHKIAAQTLSAVVPREYEPTLCGKCNLNGKPCKECYANRRANACRQEVLRRGKEFLKI